MDANARPEPPSHGYRAYAEIVKQRLIYGRFFAGWSMTQGRYHFRVIYDQDTSPRYNFQRQPLGYEMAERYLTPNDNSWVFRVYLDGTALFRPYKLRQLRYPTIRTITNMVEFFYYKEAEIPGEANRHLKTHVLRRRPLNPQHIAPQATGFGDFLKSKYNQPGGRK